MEQAEGTRLLTLCLYRDAMEADASFLLGCVLARSANICARIESHGSRLEPSSHSSLSLGDKTSPRRRSFLSLLGNGCSVPDCRDLCIGRGQGVDVEDA